MYFYISKYKLTKLKSIAEIVYRRVNPNGGNEVGNYLGEYLATAKLRYATILWKLARENKAMGGENEIPNELLRTAELEVENNEADIKNIKAYKGFNSISWLQHVGQFGCDSGCTYTVMDFNKYRLLCSDVSRNLKDKSAVPFGNSIMFFDGLHKNDTKINIIYAGDGSDIDNEFLVDDSIGGMILDELLKFYGEKVEENKSNNSNPNRDR